MWLHLLSSKDEAPAAIKEFQAQVETEMGKKLCVLRTDHGGEFTSVEFALYCAGQGVERHLTAPYSPQQNGVVERRNQMVVGMARSMLKAKRMPAAFWGEAVFILNRTPTKSLEGTTPFEAWHGRKPDVSFLRTFGCVGHVKKTKPNLAKLEDRSTPMVFLGYERGSKAYRLYDPASSKVVVSRDVVFDEAACWGWESGDAEATPGGLSSCFTVEYMVYSGTGELAHDEAEATPSSESQGTPSSATQGAPSSESQGAPSRVAQVTPSSEAEGTPSSEAEGTPSSKARGAPSSEA